jgi:hypothetical protein
MFIQGSINKKERCQIVFDFLILRIIRLCPLSIAGSLQDEDLRVVDKAVGNGRGNSGGVKYLSPVGKRQVCRNGGGLGFMPLADHLEEEI